MAVRRGLRAAIEGVTGVVADRTLRIGHAAGREPPLIEGDQGLETADAVVTDREADRRALPQPLQFLMVRRLSPPRRREPRLTKRSPSYRATRSAGIAVPMATSVRRRIVLLLSRRPSDATHWSTPATRRARRPHGWYQVEARRALCTKGTEAVPESQR